MSSSYQDSSASDLKPIISPRRSRVEELRAKRQQKLNESKQKLKNLSNGLSHDASSSPEEEVPVSNEQHQTSYSNNTQHQAQSFQSYQNSAEALEREREAFRSHSARMAAENDDYLGLGVLMPVAACVGQACRMGVSGIASQAAAGISMMKKEAEERIYTTAAQADNPRGLFQTVGISPSYQGRYSDIPDQQDASPVRAARQSPTNEATIMSC